MSVEMVQDEVGLCTKIYSFPSPWSSIHWLRAWDQFQGKPSEIAQPDDYKFTLLQMQLSKVYIHLTIWL